jgi:hypothetical protein
MTSTFRTVARLAAAAVLMGGVVLAGAAPAWADTTISINPGNVPTTASGFETHSCDQVPGGSSPTTDGWVFVLPGNKGTFTSLTLTFLNTSGGTVVINVPADSGTILNVNGTSKAVVTTPAGWTLIAATATISGSSNGFFVLTHTCPATGTSPPPPPSSPPPSSPPTSSSSSSTSAAAYAQKITTSVLPALVLGFAFFAGWAGLIVARRRRDAQG